MRVGLNSGPVTAGVLRGDRSRLQLLGDTVNTGRCTVKGLQSTLWVDFTLCLTCLCAALASISSSNMLHLHIAARMESTGMRNKIQVSQETAELIIAAGKSQWIRAREGTVVAKGKIELQTYWLLPKYEAAPSTHTTSESGVSDGERMDIIDWMNAANTEDTDDVQDGIEAYDENTQRLVDYNVDILTHALKKIIAQRNRSGKKSVDEAMKNIITKLESELGCVGSCLEEVVEVIELPKFDSAKHGEDVNNAEVSAEVLSELSNYVEIIASMYRNNPFHNFDHASHVTQSTTKLLSKIVAAKHIGKGEELLPDHNYGIVSIMNVAILHASAYVVFRYILLFSSRLC